jgi:hypothetical protein
MIRISGHLLGVALALAATATAADAPRPIRAAESDNGRYPLRIEASRVEIGRLPGLARPAFSCRRW